MFKRLCLAFALTLGLAAFARGAETCSKTDAANRKEGLLPTCLALDAVVATTESATVDTFGYKTIRVQVWSNSDTTTATVIIKTRSGANAPWFTVATITDPTTVGEHWSIPQCFQIAVEVSAWTDGGVSANIERYKNAN